MESRAQRQSCNFHRPPAKHQVHPWLLIRHGSAWHRQTFCDVSEDHYYTRIILDLCNKQIYPTSREWLVLRDWYSEECCVWNPNSMEKVQLPRAAHIDLDCCFLTFSPSVHATFCWFICGRKHHLVLPTQRGRIQKAEDRAWRRGSIDECFNVPRT